METSNLIAPLLDALKPIIYIGIGITIIKFIINSLKNIWKWGFDFGLSKWSNNDILPYSKRDYFLTIPERRFYDMLWSVIWSSYVIVPQVVLSSLVKTTANKQSYWKRHNKINKKTLDFVVFKKPYFQPVVAIEFDWVTHERKDRMERDSFVDKVLQLSWINIIHYKPSSSTPEQLQQQLSWILV